MKRCMLVGLNVTCTTIPDTKTGAILGRSRQATNIVPGYTLTLDSEEWRLERGEFIQQVDPFNCSPIACMKILVFYSLIDAHEVRLAYSTKLICALVITEWQRLISACSGDLHVHVKEQLPLLEPHPDRETRDVPIVTTAIAATIAASVDIPEASMDICSCCSDSPMMDLVRLLC
jgi:hypothetical protein